MSDKYNILITGGAGYIGSTLVPLLLEQGHRVRVLDVLLHGGNSLLNAWSHPSFEFVHADIRNSRTVKESLKGINAVVHLAAIVGDPACARQPDEAREINLDASLALLEECRRANVRRFVFASTCSNYGKMTDSNGYVDENSQLAPVSLYAETKVAFEKALLAIPASESFCATPLRFATVYGVSSRMRFDLTVNEFTKEMVTKKWLVVFGEQFWRPYVHVRDAARAIALVLNADPGKLRGQVYNIGATSQNYRKKDLIDLIRVRAPDANVQYVRKEEDPRDYRVCFSKVSQELGFAPSRTVEDGIDEVARLVRSGLIRSLEDPCFRN